MTEDELKAMEGRWLKIYDGEDDYDTDATVCDAADLIAEVRRLQSELASLQEFSAKSREEAQGQLVALTAQAAAKHAALAALLPDPDAANGLETAEIVTLALTGRELLSVRDAISSDAGKGWLSPEEHDRLVAEAVEKEREAASEICVHLAASFGFPVDSAECRALCDAAAAIRKGAS